jgi:hypothetical protein
MFSCPVIRCRRKFCSHWRVDVVDVKEFEEDLILSGKVGSLPSTERAVGQQQPESSG